ncbi:GNAT family N-acetyltransferase [Leucobacter sp. M11]|uniref:GNAT family N-acetyltransferase n=1 Tax=Leucobacter sp. M11 TaxID=2993565 RepID=UPI002D7F1267|nr:GNAT family N-acetyltransferase [Leucobacter sp. M11]MEB4615798.1 GNAT family N-acetyltransferase [Leucobacter sp. M11]
MIPGTEHRSERLRLTPLGEADLAEVHAIFADPGTWAHLPEGRHRSPEQTRELLRQAEQSWQRFGAGQWALRLREDLSAGLPAGALIGVGGVTAVGPQLWNLGYRLTPEAWGRGFATEVARVALRAAREARPEWPVTARVLSNNPASEAVLARVGLSRVWAGQPSPAGARADASHDELGVRRHALADRAVPAAGLAWLIEHA